MPDVARRKEGGQGPQPLPTLSMPSTPTPTRRGMPEEEDEDHVGALGDDCTVIEDRHSVVFLIDTILIATCLRTTCEVSSQDEALGTISYTILARQLRQMPGNPWEDYRDKKPVWERLEVTRTRASRLFGATAARRRLAAYGLELTRPDFGCG